jgi:proline dehydrogenase
MVTTASIRRRVAFAIATNDDIESTVRRVRVLDGAAYRAAQRYVAGETQTEALETARGLLAAGFAVAVDFFGENVGAADEARTVGDRYVELAHAVGELDGDATLALAAVREVALAGAPLQITLQANLRRSSEDWPVLVEAGIAVRLVKGAYVEGSQQAHPYGDETDIAYVRLAHELHGAGARFALATHDPVIREALLAALGPTPVEMLLGVREEDARALVGRGVPIRLYVPFGRRWFRYWMRRVAEAQGA